MGIEGKAGNPVQRPIESIEGREAQRQNIIRQTEEALECLYGHSFLVDGGSIEDKTKYMSARGALLDMRVLVDADAARLFPYRAQSLAKDQDRVNRLIRELQLPALKIKRATVVREMYTWEKKLFRK